MSDPEFSVRTAHWSGEAPDIKRIRQQVFVQEQGVPETLEWDGKDAGAVHLLAKDGRDRPIGTARMLANGHIGRMAVLPDWRNQGVGSALLDRLLEIARRDHYAIPFLNAQTDAMNFYLKQGFETQGDVFMDAGIPHIRMALKPGRLHSNHAG